jgi:hypothetical protein
MIAPAGYFYAAQDADSFVDGTEDEPEEGAFYVWSYRALEESLTADELQSLSDSFTVMPGGNFEGNIVLQRTRPGNLSVRVEQALGKLFAIRYGDTTVDAPLGGAGVVRFVSEPVLRLPQRQMRFHKIGGAL